MCFLYLGYCLLLLIVWLACTISQEIASGPPAGWTLVDNQGQAIVELTKSYNGEKIVLRVDVTDQVLDITR